MRLPGSLAGAAEPLDDNEKPRLFRGFAVFR